MSLFDSDLIQKEIDINNIIDSISSKLTYRGELPVDNKDMLINVGVDYTGAGEFLVDMRGNVYIRYFKK